jgi:plasmid stability protein
MGNIQLKNVPDDLHQRLRERARREGMAMRDYALRVLERDLAKPTLSEWFDRVAAREPEPGPPSSEDVVAAISAGREERTRQVLEAVGLDPGEAARLSRES